jgi:protein-disulfide isomerase/uncharacterized membrane protein
MTGNTAPSTAGTVTAPSRPPIAAWRVVSAVVLCVANAALAGLLLLQHHGQSTAVAAVNQLCGAGGESGCAAVAASPWSKVGGVPLAALGLTFYLAVALLLLLGVMAGPTARAAAAALALLALALALAVDVALLGVQKLAIGAFCTLCIATYVLTVLAALALLPARRDGSVVGEAVTQREGRLALAAWALATVFFGVGIAMAELGLARGQAAAGANVLGTAGVQPLPALPPGATEADRYREEARAATEQARRLQEILDDPAKFERYQNEKAEREFVQGPVNMLDLGGVPFKGPEQAPIKVVEFSDFLCPFCRNVASAFDRYLPTTGGRVVVYYKNFPLEKDCNTSLGSTVHAGACLLALGGLCAQEQGRFWPFHDRVFAATLTNPGTSDVQRLATEGGLDAAAFEKCMASGAQRQKLTAEIAEAVKAGVNSTPTLFINGKRVPNLANFATTVESEARRLGLPPMHAPGGSHAGHGH